MALVVDRAAMRLYDAIADLSLTVDDHDLDRRSADTSSGFERVTTVVSLHGAGETGRGEDVTYDTEDHEALAAADDPFDLAGEYTFDEFSAMLDDVDLFPGREPERESAHHYRRWGVESAALDLALRQNDTHLGAALGRDRDPVRFVVSTRLGDPPTTDRVEALLDAYPETEFKLDPTSDWTDEVVADLAALDRVRILDLKGQYVGTVVDQDPDPDLYRRVVEGFPEAIVEDPALTDETEPVLAGAHDRISWDAPITGVESVEALPFEPEVLNVKPSRFGTVASLLDTLDHCREHDVDLYGGGQFELDVGRDHIQLLASLFYPDSPNDVAPSGYNDPDVSEGLPTSPLDPGDDPAGLSW
jgi:L-alanine-DL-glutamate epimerase-like enolase superfamily enzyme